jgi:hypothetical protein
MAEVACSGSPHRCRPQQRKAILALFNAKFLLSFGAFLGVYWSLYGIAFALGFAARF